jgi:very-short-patch-repair endonuclease
VVSPLRLDAVAAALGQRSRGAVRARGRLTLADPASGSPAETVARLRMHDAGLHPETQAEVVTSAGRVLRPDFLFRAQGVAVEIEGYAYHGRCEDHRRDVARFNDLQQCPEVRFVLRFTAEEVFRSPGTVIATIRRAVGSGSAGGGAPCLPRSRG